MSHHEVARLIIAATVVVGFFGLIAVTLFYPLDDVTVEVDDVGIGALLTAFVGVVGYYFRGKD